MDIQIKKKAKDDQSFQQRSRLGEELSRNLQQENLQRPLYRTDENVGQIKQQEDPSSLFDISVNAKKLVYQEKAGIAAKKAREQLENNFAGLLEQERKEVSVPNLQEMKASHEAKYRTRVIKRTLKPNKMVTEQVVEEKERRTKEKSAMAKLTSTAWREVTDAKVKARADVDIDLKKKMDYRTFSQLSEFAPYLDKEQLNALVTLYGNGVSMERKHEKKKLKNDEEKKKAEEERKEAREKSIFPAMDMLTNLLLKMEPESFDLSSDRAIAHSAPELEKMSAAVSSYQELLTKNSDYLEHLTAKKLGEEQGGISYGDRIMHRLEELSAISNYYKLRRLVIEDDLYTSLANEEISMEEQEGDDVKTKNLKRNMRLSYYAGVQLQKVFNGVEIAPETFKTKDAGADVLMSRRMDAVEADYQQKNTLSSEAERHLEYLKELGAQQKLVDRTVREQLLIAPKEQYNMLTLDPQKMRTTPACGKYAHQLFQVKGAAIERADMIRVGGGEKLNKRYQEMGEKKKGGWADCPRFVGGKDESLSRIQLSDAWSRTSVAFNTEYNYRRTDEEFLEMLDLLSIQTDTAAWKEIQKDPEKVAYYESAYKEMTMKHLEGVYGCAVRTAQTIGMKALLLHPVDLVQQATIELKQKIMANAIVTNIAVPDNLKIIQNLFKENDPEQKYLFDTENFSNIGSAFSAINIKLVSPFEMTGTFYTRDDERPSEYYLGYDVEKALTKEAGEYIAQLKKEGKTEEASKFEALDHTHQMDWYLSRHPEIYSVKNLLKKDRTGKYIHREAGMQGVCSSLSNGEQAFHQIIKSKQITVPSDEELKKYEDSLKQRNFYTLRQADASESIAAAKKDITKFQGFIENDIKKLKEMEQNPKNNDTVYETMLASTKKHITDYQNKIAERQAYINYMEKHGEENYKNDPYALRMIKNGLEELKYTDGQGQEKILKATSVF